VTRRIAHLYADVGVEDEVLYGFGEVVRVGLDPDPNPFSTVVRADARHLPLADDFDLAFVHHPCGRWSNAGGDPDDHPDHLDHARQVARDLADHYVLENVPQAPLRDPVVLRGDDFGLPIAYPRAFETSFRVERPNGRARWRPNAGPLAARAETGNAWAGATDGWRLAKGYSHPWPGRDLKRHGIPAPYVRHLLYWWLTARRGGSRSEQTSLAHHGGETA
jgi:hypothetical protein